jgi:hypothetical protein
MAQTKAPIVVGSRTADGYTEIHTPSLNGEGDYVALVYKPEDAAAIVKSFNAHDELVAALRKAERVLNHIGAASGSEHIGAWEAVRDAIAKVAP